MKRFNARLFLTIEYWLPLLSSIALILLCILPVLPGYDLLRAANILSKDINRLFIVLSLALLLLTGTRIFPSRIARSVNTRWWALDIAISTLIISHSLKYLIGLPRPSGSPTGSISGHTMFAFALAWLILETYPRLAPLWFGIAVAIGWSRIETGAHYPYQVPLGAALGILLGWLVANLPHGVLFPRLLRLRNPDRTKSVPEEKPVSSHTQPAHEVIEQP